eukprot:GHVU01166510.1.p3 GENE.GHVU01166510.1~~GHVU01166510.1.p3  ORF type:complete len:119 (-),score=20.33 GHVU01166510.1:27-383(-)
MTNDFTASAPSLGGKFWDPTYPMEGIDLTDEALDIHRILSERRERNLFQQLEKSRLGHILTNAWNERYVSVDEVIRDITLEAMQVGITISGDEVDIGAKWEDVFELKDGKLEFIGRND